MEWGSHPDGWAPFPGPQNRSRWSRRSGPSCGRCWSPVTWRASLPKRWAGRRGPGRELGPSPPRGLPALASFLASAPLPGGDRLLSPGPTGQGGHREPRRAAQPRPTCHPQIRQALELRLGRPLQQYRDFIDNQMLLLMAQQDRATRIFPHLYLVSCGAEGWERRAAAAGGQ